MRTALAVFASSVCVAAAVANGQATRPAGGMPAAAAGRLGPKVQVFPFTAVQAGGANGWFGKGIAESLQTDVARTAAVLTTGGTPLTDGADPVAAAKAAGVDLAVVGSYQVNGDQIRIDGRVVDVATGGTVGGMSATGPIRDFFKLEDGLGDQMQKLLPGVATTAAAPMPPGPGGMPPGVQQVAGQTVVPPQATGGTTVIIIQPQGATTANNGGGNNRGGTDTGTDLPPLQNTYVNNYGSGGGYGGSDGFDQGYFPQYATFLGGTGYGGYGYGGFGYGGYGYGGNAIFGFYPGLGSSGYTRSFGFGNNGRNGFHGGGGIHGGGGFHGGGFHGGGRR